MKRRLIAVFGLILSSFLILPSPEALAYTFGRDLHQTYYKGTMATYRSYIMQPEGSTPWFGITPNWETVDITVDSFINSVRARLYDPLSVGNRARTSAVINMMMGHDGDSTIFSTPFAQRHLNGIKVAQDNFGIWESIVRLYDSRGWVQWNAYITSCEGDINGFAEDTTPGGGGLEPDVIFSTLATPGCGIDKAIIFHINGSPTVTFTIKDKCGNMSGEESPFANFAIQTSIQSGAGTPDNPPGNWVQTGNPYQVRALAWNAGPGVAPAETYRVTVPAGVTVTNTHGGTQIGNTVTWTGVMINGLGFGNGQSRLLDWFVNPGVTNGTGLTFTFVATPYNLSGGSTPPVSITYVIQNPRLPAVQGKNSDIHAGGELCGSPPSVAGGFIKGLPGAGSYGDYVVASSNIINNFGSSGSGTSTSLHLGQNGNYARVCRPNLYAAALAYRSSGEPATTVTASSFSVTGKEGVYFLDAATTAISGVISRKLTLVTNGSVVINGPLTIDNALYASKNAPSLGIIAHNNISINPNVTRVDAYLFANGVINTCASATAPACATPTLAVNGFLVSRDILFRRLGPVNSAGQQIAERIVMIPQIYLNPPVLFDGAHIDNLGLFGQGERQPLF